MQGNQVRMGQFLKVLSGLGTGYFILSRLAGSLYNKVNYSFGTLRRKDIRFGIVEGRFVAQIPVTLYVTQTTGVNLSSNGLYLVLGQQGTNFGEVRLSTAIVLPTGVQTPIRFNLLLDAGNVVSRLQAIVSANNANNLFAPITMKGHLILSNGWEVPINYAMKF